MYLISTYPIQEKKLSMNDNIFTFQKHHFLYHLIVLPPICDIVQFRNIYCTYQFYNFGIFTALSTHQYYKVKMCKKKYLAWIWIPAEFFKINSKVAGNCSGCKIHMKNLWNICRISWNSRIRRKLQWVTKFAKKALKIPAAYYCQQEIHYTRNYQTYIRITKSC
jgi:hypothetical protein